MNSNPINQSPKGLDYRELTRPYLKQWKWFLVCFIVAIVLALVYIRYATPQYAVKAKIQILEDQGPDELSAFRDLELFSGGNTKVEDEIEILNSRSNIIEVIKELGLNITISAVGNIHNTEIYENPPFKVNFLIPDSLVYHAKDNFQIEIISETAFSYQAEPDTPVKMYSFGNAITSEIGEFVITPNAPRITDYKGKEYSVSVNPVNLVAQNYREKLQVTVTDEYSNIVSLTLNLAVEQKAINFINALISVYNRHAIEDKKTIADKTSEFINNRIADIYGDLSAVDQTAEEFKAGRGITDVASQSNLNLNVGASSQQELQNANTQLNIASSMKNIVENQTDFEVLPANVGLSNGSIANTTARYNELVLERKRLLKSSNEKNPIIVNLDQQLNGLKKSLQSSLNSMTNNLNLQVNNLSSQLAQINARIYAAPRNERALRDITRQQQTTESLYLYLLQKREESQITFASAIAKSKVIDSAYGLSEFPVAPKKPIIMLMAGLLSIMVPFSFIYVGQLLDNKVHNKVGLEKLVGGIPVLAEIPKLNKKESILVKWEERTVLAESLRILRTNMDYLIKSKRYKEGGNLIFVTSSVSGEGKTLVASNLAMIFANANKKVLLIGGDIRNPKIYQFYSGKHMDKLGKPYRNKDNKGLTDYLIDRSLQPKDVISTTLVNQQAMDIIYSGKIPPNPAELLMKDRLPELFGELRKMYDYIIVDTAPLMVVSDTLLISEHADQTLYVTRAGMTETKVLEFPLKLHAEGKLKGLSFVVNAVKSSNLGYGGKYGYGYGKSIRKWWRAS